MRLGKHERELLFEIETSKGDMLLGFLCSAGSVSRMYRGAYHSAKSRQEKRKKLYDLQQRRKRMIEQLKKKGLIQLSGHGKEVIVTTTSRAQEYVEINKVSTSIQATVSWDQKWTLVMFDIPTQEKLVRTRLSHILQKIGFEQVQLSVYAFPNVAPELEKFLAKNEKYGQYCHVFRGRYKGDDTNLRKKFKLLS